MMPSPRWSSLASLLMLGGLSTAASVAQAQPLTAEERTERSANIRDVAADNGISAGFLLAGIAQAETNLSHCWDELTWACEGPASPDCDGGPVVAGAGDGPCELQQGGLGMFQFDGGTFDETIARDGDGVLLLSGNVTRAVDFVVNMVMGSTYVDASTPDEAKAWMNQVTVDGPLWDAWITTVTHYYNGCVPGSCSLFDDRYQHYSDSTADVYFEQGDAFWVVAIPPCAAVPPAGRMLEETDTCFTKGGPLPYWRVGIGGESNLHVWTGTTADLEAVNFADWALFFEEAGQYRVEVSVTNGTTPLAAYLIDHGGTTSEVVVDQAAATGFVELGTFAFDTGEGQGVYVGDNTGDAEPKHLVVDALRLTRIDGGGGAGGSVATGGSGPVGGAGSDGGAGNGGGGSDAFGAVPGSDDGGCACVLAGGRSRGSASLGLIGGAIVVGLARARRLRRRAARPEPDR